jgi:aspartyl-tRNA(Asn)/glutamyl-tRNA(Gln) amidotransferase subunit A
MTDLAQLSLGEASALLQAGRASARDLVEACLARIAAEGRAINAFVAVDEENARRAALASDERRARRVARGPLDGVPLAHKDIFERAGRRLTAGSIILDTKPERTAPALAKLDAAGAIDLGPLHLAEFAAGATGHNRHFGACRNPWRLERIPGGSSSGSAAAVAARLVMGSLGTDTGGSLRLPAHFCGVAALRPTPGRVSCEGVFPRAWSMDAVGPIARTAADLGLIFATIAERDEAGCVGEAASLAGRRIGIPDRFFFERVEPGIGDLIEAARRDFAKLGARVVAVECPDPAPLFEHALIVAQAEAAAIHRRWIAERSADYDHGTVDGIEGGFAIAAHAYAESLAARGPARKAWVDGVFAQCDLLLTPVFEHATPRLDDCDPARPGAMREFLARFGRCTRPFSYLGLPALALPCGFQPDGMPAALQLVARPNAEAELLAAGQAYQNATDWHRRAPSPAAHAAA